MMYTLPTSKKEALSFLSQILQKARELFGSKKAGFKRTTVLSLVLIAMALINGQQPAQRLISPMTTSSLGTLPALSQNVTTPENFAFVPDLARNKFPDIDLEGLTNLAFFDIPLNESGEMNYNSRGYASFHSSEAQELFERARSQNTKIFLTISALDANIIRDLLDNPDAQQKLADQAVEEINNANLSGITIDFEFPKGEGKDYQNRFTRFISLLTDNIRSSSPQTRIAVAIPSSLADNQSLYNIEDLGKTADRIFLIASNFIVPEFQNTKPANPIFGFSANEYFGNISNLLTNLQSKIPANKLVLERAWYGNGNNYPLYKPDTKSASEEIRQSSKVHIDQETLERLVAGVPEKGKEAAKTNIPLIAGALAAEDILDSNVLAYALATIEHETDETFAPIEEIQGAINARRLGYEGGANYFGRGFIQITHLRNYREFGKRIGLGDKLVKNPELANVPEIAARILAAYFKDNNVANLASQGHFVAARTPINPDYNGYSVANLAMKYDI